MKKKHKNAIHDLKKKKLETLITAIAALLAAVLSLICLGCCIYNLCLPAPAYDDLIQKKYTFVRYEERNTDPYSLFEDCQIYVYVKEEAVPLLIQNTHTDKVKKDISALKENTSLHCRLQNTDHPDCAYEILEIKSDTPIMTLEQYNQIANQNTLWSAVIFFVLTLIMAILSVIEYLQYNKTKKKIQSLSERTPQ